MKTAKEFAEVLEGREYCNEITTEERANAKESRIVVVYGSSDDLMEFAGAIYDEVSCYNGGTAYITPYGLLENRCPEDDCPYFQEEKQKAVKIEAIWNRDGYSWVYETEIPHETFNIMEDGEFYCRGIVFSLADLLRVWVITFRRINEKL